MPTYVTITAVDVAQAVADEINLPANLANWSQTGFAAAAREWLPAYEQSALATLQIAVIAIKRDRERSADRGSTRGSLQSEHMIRIMMQKTVDPSPAIYKPQIDALAAFIHQVDDYFMAKNRKLNQVAGHAVGADNVYCTRSSVTTYGPKDLAEHGNWVGQIEQTFTERTAW